MKENRNIVLLFWGFMTGISVVTAFNDSTNVNAETTKQIVVSNKKEYIKLPIVDADTIVMTDTVDSIDKINDYPTVSENGKNLIKKFESLSLKSVRLKGETSNTIGWGHKINSDDPLWLRRMWVGKTITKKEADKLFEKDIENFINPSLKRITNELASHNVRLNQDEIDGLASLIYNCGEEGVKNTYFYTLLKKGKKHKAIKAVADTHVYQRGHRTRRQAEKEMMLGNLDINEI